MNLFLDTTVLVDVLRGFSPAVRFLTQAIHDDHELLSACVVRTEVLAGMRPREEGPTRELLGLLGWLDITVEIADRAGELARKWLRSHPGVDTVDYLIAAAAELSGSTLCTSNLKHFPMFKNLKPAYRR